MADEDISSVSGATVVHQWGRWEGRFESAADHADPLQGVDLRVELTAPSGARRTIAAFWDGGRNWRARFCPDEQGTWTYRTQCLGAVDHGLDGRSGSLACVAYEGDNPLYRHGVIRLAPSRRHLEYADGTPFFYLADTGWNGPLRSTAEEWEVYLTDRAGKGFTAVQYATTQWRTAPGDVEGHLAYLGKEHIGIDPAFFQRFDQRVDAINAHGLLAVPLMLHAGPDTLLNAGYSLPEDQIVVLARYMVARYGAHYVLWDLVGEPMLPTAEVPERWRRIGRAVFGGGAHLPVVVHPHPRDGLALETFGAETWLDIVGYQSGHSTSDEVLRWLVEGPPSTDWALEPTRPFINLEPPYEGFVGPGDDGVTRKPLDTAAVRRSTYWSLLVSPTAGVTYGGHGVWGWDDGSGPPFGHPNVGTPLPWREALGLPGSWEMQHLASLMASLSWWRLMPAPALLARQPGKDHVKSHVAAARTDDGSLALVYMPHEMGVDLRLDSLQQPLRGTWFDPRTGARREVNARVPGGEWGVATPGAGDWVLILESETASPRAL
jgi:hypothetical protein